VKANPLFVKACALGAVVALLALALNQIGTLVAERQGRMREAERSVEQSLAGRQALLGPVVISSCTEEWTDEVGEGRDRKPVPARRDFILSAMPRQLAAEASATMEPRHRGLFKVNTYASKTTLRAQWTSLAALRPRRDHAGSRIACAAPVLMMAVSDARGIRQAVVKVNGDALPAVAGTRHPSHPRGFHAVLPDALLSAQAQGDAPFSADVTLELAGTAELALVPIGDDTQLKLAANWPHPSFGGRFLPITRDVRADGFNATWQVSSLATTASGDFARGAALCAPDGGAAVDEGDATGRARVAVDAARAGDCIESFDVAFIDPVNPYSLSDRATKYGLLFIGLTFLAVAMVEVLRQLRVHPVQYLLVGCALSVFFLLLLSLSEHLRFDVSYAIAAGACVALLTFYAKHVLGGSGAGLAFGGGIAALYGVLYALLQLEQTALVFGSVLLFAVLAGVMVLTRRVDWHRLLNGAAAAGAPMHGRPGTVPAA
jgi:inner membrane protein